jgi:hypothetical protein
MTFFDILRNILVKADPNLISDPSFAKALNIYMLINYLSMEPKLLPYAEIIQKFLEAKIPPIQIYEWAYKHVPKQKNGYIQYIKAKKPKKKEMIDVTLL